MAIQYLKHAIKSINKDFDENNEKTQPYHEFINISKLTRLLLFFSSTKDKKYELMKVVTEITDILGLNKTEVNRLVYVIGVEVVRDLVGDEKFNKKTLINLDLRNLADFNKRQPNPDK